MYKWVYRCSMPESSNDTTDKFTDYHINDNCYYATLSLSQQWNLRNIIIRAIWVLLRQWIFRLSLPNSSSYNDAIKYVSHGTFVDCNVTFIGKLFRSFGSKSQ